MKFSKKNLIKFFKILFSRSGSIVLFSTITSFIIFGVTMNDHLDEITHRISSISSKDIYNSSGDCSVLLSPVNTPCVEKKVITDIKEIDCPTIKISSPYLDEGQTIVCPGVPGQLITEYEEVMVNGKLVATNQISGNKLTPIPKKILIGVRKPIVNKISSVDLDENGCPINYEMIFQDRVATAYTANPGDITSTGKAPRVGFVAVNPKVIPYHSVLYLKCCNKNFSGVFIAEDTGGAMRRGHADIDVFMSTRNECMNFGRQKINIYILSRGV